MPTDQTTDQQLTDELHACTVDLERLWVHLVPVLRRARDVSRAKWAIECARSEAWAVDVFAGASIGSIPQPLPGEDEFDKAVWRYENVLDCVLDHMDESRIEQGRPSAIEAAEASVKEIMGLLSTQEA